MPKQVDHEERRQTILEALFRIAARDGLGAASIRAVAAEAGIPAPQVQYYFGTKGRLLDGALDLLTSVLSRSADTAGAVAIALLVVIILARRRRWRDAVVLVAGLGLELFTFLAVNFLVDRPRPAVPKLGSVPSTSSYPSGHSAAVLVIYASIAIFVSAGGARQASRVLAWAAAVIMPTAVGFARVYRGMHHPLDVAAGLVMGAAVLFVAFAAFRAADVAARGAPESNGSAPLERERV